MKTRTAVLATFGTLGDIYPFVAIAHALASRDVEPTIAAPVTYREAIEAEDVRWVRLRPDMTDIAEALRTDNRGAFEMMLRNPHFILDQIYMRFLRETFDDVQRAAAQADIMLTHSLLVGASQAAEAVRLPCARIALAPLHLQSAAAPPMTPGAPYCLSPSSRGATTYNRVVRQAVRFATNVRMGKLRSFRAAVGLPKTREDFFLDFGRPNSADAVFGLWSPLFAPTQPDHPKNLTVPGFPFYQPRDRARKVLAAGLDAFLSAGEPPIVFTLGSFAPEVSGNFYDNSLRAARALGRRAVLLAGEKEAARLTRSARQDVYVCASAPHAALFPQSLCVVHHGGIGTTAEAMRAGKPQIVVPFFGDQPDHGVRIERLGLGFSVPLSSYDVRGATDALYRVLEGPFGLVAASVSEQIASELGVDAIADWAVRTLLRGKAAA